MNGLLQFALAYMCFCAGLLFLSVAFYYFRRDPSLDSTTIINEASHDDDENDHSEDWKRGV